MTENYPDCTEKACTYTLTDLDQGWAYRYALHAIYQSSDPLIESDWAQTSFTTQSSVPIAELIIDPEVSFTKHKKKLSLLIV